MCIAVPEKIVSIRETETGLWGKTERAGVVHETDLSLLGAVRAGDWVLVFRGIRSAGRSRRGGPARRSGALRRLVRRLRRRKRDDVDKGL